MTTEVHLNRSLVEEEDLSTTTIRIPTPTDHCHTKHREPVTPTVDHGIKIPEQLGKKVDPNPSFIRSRSLRSESSRSRKSHRNVGIVIGDFKGLYRDELSLNIGERIEIISKDTIVSRNIGWWTGRNDKGKTGIFPANCVKIVTSHSVSDHLEVEDVDGAEFNQYPLEIPVEDVKLCEVIGMGGFGKVHRAIYKDEEVAVKVARNATYDSMKVITEVLNEAEKFAYLAHDNVCALVGVCLVKDVYLVMEYAKGGPLSKVLHEKKISLPINIILDWSRQIVEGMQYLHHEAKPSLIHRDLKSSNILLQNVVDPNDLVGNVIKITDFGLAREIEHTTQMSAAGTYPWMAPEVIRACEFSHKSDVWSFGVVLWELLTEEKPYGGLNMFVVAYGVGHGTLTLPIPENCPDSLKKLMKDCWERDHTSRPDFKSIRRSLVDIQRSEFSQTSHEEFRTMQSFWKKEVQQKFEELKHVEKELQMKEQALMTKMKVQEQRVEEMKKELEEKEKNLVGMMDELQLQLQEIAKERAKKVPPRIKRYSPRKLIEWLASREPRRSKSISENEHGNSEKIEVMAAELTNKIKGLMQNGEDNAGTKQLTVMSRHRRQSSADSRSIDLQDRPSTNKRGRSLISRRNYANEQVTNSSKIRDRSTSDPHHQEPPPSSPRLTASTSPKGLQLPVHPQISKRGSIDGSPASPKLLISAEHDSGKGSMSYSDASTSSSDVQNLIDLNSFGSPSAPPRRNLSGSYIAELDPLNQVMIPTRLVSTTSIDSLLCDTVSSITSTFSSSPETNAASKHSPRHSISTVDSLQFTCTSSPVMGRPHPHTTGTGDKVTSAPTSRPTTPSLLRRSATSPTGSVQSLPQYPTFSNEPYYLSDTSSNNSSILDMSPWADSDADQLDIDIDQVTLPELKQAFP